MNRIRKFLGVVTIAALLFGGTGAVQNASAHTYVAGVSCGSSVSPSSGQIRIGYHYAGSPWHYYYWRAMTAGEYWTYCW